MRLSVQKFFVPRFVPFFNISSIDLLKKNKNPSEQEIRDWLEGNICRCTGYQGIVAAVKDAASKM